MAKIKSLFTILVMVAAILIHRSSAEITSPSDLEKCQFYDEEKEENVPITFPSKLYKCVECGNDKHIKPKNISQDFCSFHCEGLKCALGSKCIHFRDINKVAACGEAKLGSYFNEDGKAKQGAQIPVIIGFTTGGVLLLLIIVGIIVTRRSSPEDERFSEIATTPMSWGNSYEYGGKGYQGYYTPSNRVEEIQHNCYQNGNTNYRFYSKVSTNNECSSATNADAVAASDWPQQTSYAKEVCGYESSPLAEGTELMIEDQDLVEYPENDTLLNCAVDDNSNYRHGKYAEVVLESEGNTNDKYSQPMDCHFSPMATVIDQQYWSKNDNSRPRCFSAMEHAYPLHYDAHSTIAYRTKNLTYVVVDVHKNSQLSTEDLCGDRGRSSVFDGTASVYSSLGKNAMRKIFQRNYFSTENSRLVDRLSLSPRKSATPPSETNPKLNERQPSMDLLNDRGYRTCPRHIRLSSAGSGEYSLPYDAIA